MSYSQTVCASLCDCDFLMTTMRVTTASINRCRFCGQRKPVVIVSTHYSDEKEPELKPIKKPLPRLIDWGRGVMAHPRAVGFEPNLFRARLR